MKSILAAMMSVFFLSGLVEAKAQQGEITVYSGRSKNLIEPVFEKFTAATGIKVNARYGSSAEMAATILEEGGNSPADLFIAQDAGALGSLASEGKLDKLPEELLKKVDARYRSPEGHWVGTSGRVRVVAYGTNSLKESDLPQSILGFTDPKWRGKIGWAPSNGSFQAFVTAMRVKMGDGEAAKWLRGILANGPKVYSNNSAIVAGVGAGEVQVGFVNHYYLFNFLKERGEGFPVRNYYPRGGDIGAMVNVAGAGIVKTTKKGAEARKFVEYLLGPEAQGFFAGGTEEYPIVDGTEIDPRLKPLAEIEAPNLDLGKLSDLKGTLRLLQETGVME